MDELSTYGVTYTVGEVGNESRVMKSTLAAYGVILLLYMGLAVLYTVTLFPNFGA